MGIAAISLHSLPAYIPPSLSASYFFIFFSAFFLLYILIEHFLNFIFFVLNNVVGTTYKIPFSWTLLTRLAKYTIVATISNNIF